MNRRERRAARTRRPSPVELEKARAAIVAAFSDPELAAGFEYNAPDMLLEMAGVVASGYTTAERAAITLTQLHDLADATVRGDITASEGHSIVAQRALAERKGQEPD